MAKAYWIAHVTVEDADTYQHYANAAPKAFRKYGAKILARGGRSVQLEGEGKLRNVVIEFASFEDAVNCYNSDEYQSAKSLRKNAGMADILIVEGC